MLLIVLMICFALVVSPSINRLVIFADLRSSRLSCRSSNCFVLAEEHIDRKCLFVRPTGKNCRTESFLSMIASISCSGSVWNMHVCKHVAKVVVTKSGRKSANYAHWWRSVISWSIALSIPFWTNWTLAAVLSVSRNSR